MLANATKWDTRFLDMAKLVSTWSKDPSTQTGAVIVKPDRSVVAVGFNGFPKTMPDWEEYYNDREEKYSRIVHCEMNAVLSTNQSVEDCTLYTYPFLSCDRCAVHMIQAGIVRFVAPICPPDKAVRWEEHFKKTRRYAKECGVKISEVVYG
jgi:dCMP deaminase